MRNAPRIVLVLAGVGLISACGTGSNPLNLPTPKLSGDGPSSSSEQPAEEPGAGPAASNTADPSAPGMDDAPVAMRSLVGNWGSNWADPLVFVQSGDRATAKIVMNGTLDCAWNGVSRYNCSWKHDRAAGKAQIWWDGDMLRGTYGAGSSYDMETLEIWARNANGPVTGTTSSSSAKGCNYNSECSDPMTRCLESKCVQAVGTKCSIASDCSSVGNKFACKANVCSTR